MVFCEECFSRYETGKNLMVFVQYFVFTAGLFFGRIAGGTSQVPPSSLKRLSLCVRRIKIGKNDPKCRGARHFENFVRGFQKYRRTNSKDSQDFVGFLGISGISGDSKGFLKILGDFTGFSGIQQSEKHGVSKDSDGFRQNPWRFLGIPRVSAKTVRGFWSVDSLAKFQISILVILQQIAIFSYPLSFLLQMYEKIQGFRQKS